MTKEELQDEIESYGEDIKNETIETYDDSRYGISNKIEVGEYAFPESEHQEDYDFIMEDMEYNIKSETNYSGDLSFVCRSFKSGTEVYIDGPDCSYDDVYEELYQDTGYEFGYSDIIDFSHRELTKILSYIKNVSKNFHMENNAYNEDLTKITEILDGYALGKRSGCFSNGEVIFSPTETYKGANEPFTPYYNPNEA